MIDLLTAETDCLNRKTVEAVQRLKWNALKIRNQIKAFPHAVVGQGEFAALDIVLNDEQLDLISSTHPVGDPINPDEIRVLLPVGLTYGQLSTFLQSDAFENVLIVAFEDYAAVIDGQSEDLDEALRLADEVLRNLVQQSAADIVG